MDKEYYISKISSMSNEYGDKLLQLMDKYNKTNLASITYEEARDFYKVLIENEKEKQK